MTAVRLQIVAVQVMRGLNGWLGSSSNGVIVVSSVVDGLGTEPITFQGKPYLGIKDGDMLPLGPANDPSAVFTVYYREGQLPRTLAFSLLVVRSNQGLRDIGSAINGAMADDRYKKLSDIVTTAVSAAVPAYGIVLDVAQQSIGLISSYLKTKLTTSRVLPGQLHQPVRQPGRGSPPVRHANVPGRQDHARVPARRVVIRRR